MTAPKTQLNWRLPRTLQAYIGNWDSKKIQTEIGLTIIKHSYFVLGWIALIRVFRKKLKKKIIVKNSSGNWLQSLYAAFSKNLFVTICKVYQRILMYLKTVCELLLLKKILGWWILPPFKNQWTVVDFLSGMLPHCCIKCLKFYS